MKWLELSVKSPPEFVEPLSQIFYRYGHGGVSVEQEGGFNPDEGESAPVPEWVLVKTYLPINATTDERRNRIDLGVRLVAHVSSVTGLEEREIDEVEWQEAWKSHFDVLHIGKRIVIKPTWRDYEPRKGDAIVRLDPGMAFGTGHHPTTRMCLEQMELMMKPGADVLDVGCGSGILSIAAASLGARVVTGLEIDSVAVTVAKQNVRENGARHVVHVRQGSLPNEAVSPHAYDLAVANISAKVVSEISADLVKALRPGGIILASGILKEQANGPREALAAAGARLRDDVVDGDWATLVAVVP